MFFPKKNGIPGAVDRVRHDFDKIRQMVQKYTFLFNGIVNVDYYKIHQLNQTKRAVRTVPYAKHRSDDSSSLSFSTFKYAGQLLQLPGGMYYSLLIVLRN